MYACPMETKQREKHGLAVIWKLCPVRHGLLCAFVPIIVGHLLTRQRHDWMEALSERIIRPIHRVLAQINAYVPFSAAELLIGLAAALVLGYVAVQLVLLLTRRERGKRLYRLLITLLTAVLGVYAGFCLLWGTYYYGDNFTEKSGLSEEPVSVEQLTAVTRYFADLANEYAPRVQRDGNGLYCADQAEILARSPEVYARAEELFPCLAGPRVAAKGVRFSRIMSYTDFTGFFFPFTGEANVNTDYPPGQFAATVAHELSHQRGVAREQEANFVAVLACLLYGDPDYCYSAALLAYVHLGNALYAADHEAWEEISFGLDEAVLRDFDADRAYWKQFETPVQAVSNSVYEGFLQSYDQTLGLKSYGACVDLLVNYYYRAASA